MITDLANLGPSLRGTAGLGDAKAKALGKSAESKLEKPETASSFDQILQKKVSDTPTKNSVNADKEARVNLQNKDSMSKPKDRDDVRPEKPETNRSRETSSKNEPRTARKETKSWDEPRSVKEEKRSENAEKEKTGKSTQTREQVMLEFMDSMESEFGIPPERIVEAMTSLSESDQLSSPEDSASQVIAQLDIPDDQQQRAFALYAGLLAQLKQVQEPQVPKTAWLAGGAMAADVVPRNPLTLQDRRDALNRSLDNMNQKFFMQGPEGLSGRPQALAITKGSSADLLKEAAGDSAFPMDQVSFGKQMTMDRRLSEIPQGTDFLNPQGPQAGGYGAEVQALKEQFGMTAIDPNSAEGKQLAKSLAALSSSAAALDQGLKTDPQNLQALKAEQGLNQLNGQMAGSGTGGLMGFGEDSGEGGMNSDSSGKDSSQSGEFQLGAAAGLSEAHRAGDVRATSRPSFEAMLAGAQGRSAGEADNQANIQQIMNQAQYMIKKGGGEVKIQMAPEGIGQVHMKVTVLDGKVNLEMSAETNEAKKLLESSLQELKTNLGQHRLTVDSVKVDVGNQLSSDSKNPDSQNPQKQMDMNQQQDPKNQAREFWSQFNGDRGFDRRGTFHDNPGIRAYGGSSRQVEALTPDSPGAVAQKRYAGSGKGRGLNLVA